MTDRIHTTTPDATEIEEALMRIGVVATTIDAIGEALHARQASYGNALGVMSTDLEEARETIMPVVQHLLNERNGRDAA